MCSHVQVRRLPIETSTAPSHHRATHADLIYFYNGKPSPVAGVRTPQLKPSPVAVARTPQHIDAQESAEEARHKFRTVTLESTGSLRLPTPHESFKLPLDEVVVVESWQGREKREKEGRGEWENRNGAIILEGEEFRETGWLMPGQFTDFKGSDQTAGGFTARMKANIGHGFHEEDLPPETATTSQKLELTGSAAITGHQEVAKYKDGNLHARDSESEGTHHCFVCVRAHVFLRLSALTCPHCMHRQGNSDGETEGQTPLATHQRSAETRFSARRSQEADIAWKDGVACQGALTCTEGGPRGRACCPRAQSRRCR